MTINYRIILVVLLMNLCFLGRYNKVLAVENHRLFTDSFADNNSEGWYEVDGSMGGWEVISEEYIGFVVKNGPDVPSISHVDGLNLKNFEFEYDIYSEVGVNKYTLFKYSSLSDTYALDISSEFSIDGGDEILLTKSKDSIGQVLASIPFDSEAYTWYHVKVVVNNDNIRIFIDDMETAIIDVNDRENPLDRGTVALMAWPGAYGGEGSITRVRFDNITVRDLDILEVPFFFQNDNDWGDDPYGNIYPPYTMATSGCAVTSAAMILNYHDVTSIEATDEAALVDLTPATLNEWLLDQDNGYLTDANGNGGLTNWSAIARWSVIRHELGERESTVSASTKLDFNTINYPSGATQSATLDDDFNSGYPQIIKLLNGVGTHFATAIGKKDNIYHINDPYENQSAGSLPTLDNDTYENTIYGLRRFEPTNTNLSAQIIFVQPDIDLLLIDELGRKTGKDPQTGEIINEIPGSSYNYELPIVDPANPLINPVNKGLNILEIEDPFEGQYSLQAFSKIGSEYEIKHLTYDMLANEDENIYSGIIAADQPIQVSTYKYDQVSGDAEQITLPEDVTYELLINQLNDAIEDNQIKITLLADRWIRLIKLAYLFEKYGLEQLADKTLNYIRSEIVWATPRLVSLEAKNTLTNTIDLLINL